MKPMDQILARTRQPLAPLPELLDQLKQKQPRPKPQTALTLEAQRDAKKAQRAAIDAELKPLIGQHWDGDHNGDGHHDVVAIGKRIRSLEAQRDTLTVEINALRDQIEEALEEWRLEYFHAINDIVTPIRQHLWELNKQMESVFELFQETAARTAPLKVGTVWIVRSAPQILPLITALQNFLDTDQRIAPDPNAYFGLGEVKVGKNTRKQT
jgi:DNA repair exonuclease SbcCD ATPase subunit